MIKKLLITTGAFLFLAWPVMAEEQGGVPTDENSSTPPAASSSASEGYLSVPAASTPEPKETIEAPATEVKETTESVVPKKVERKPIKASRKRVVASGPVAKGDIAGIQKLFLEFSEAWATGDAKRVASHWVLDGTYLNIFGQPAGNREEIEQLLITDLQLLKGSVQTFNDFKYRFVLGGFALVDAAGDISGMKNGDGSDVPDNPIHIYAALANRGGKWYFLSMRPYAFAKSPSAASAAPAASAQQPPAAPADSATLPAGSPPPLPEEMTLPPDNAKSKLEMDKKK